MAVSALPKATHTACTPFTLRWLSASLGYGGRLLPHLATYSHLGTWSHRVLCLTPFLPHTVNGTYSQWGACSGWVSSHLLDGELRYCLVETVFNGNLARASCTKVSNHIKPVSTTCTSLHVDLHRPALGMHAHASRPVYKLNNNMLHSVQLA